ncbi:glycosyltransferase [Methylobacterium sp. Leaf108]|uniref:glycosyltransferase n=1 Tax=Methylobacterium sp. Leaf108 TaxID=1736256 RepID=UPI0006F25BA6|nr:glycosyltransferase [Methylobacterium sp. Leaf108]KQP52730.1 glycosyl transferase [Methylobacterium sp. Leaf108]
MRNLGPALARAVVCVPARNEAQVLPHLLRSLNGQQGAGPQARLRVLVLANNGTDDMLDVVERMRGDGEIANLDLRVVEATLPREVAHVGTARRMALDAGAAWLGEDGVTDGVLLSTDADAVAPPNWVMANLRALDKAELVGGRLIIDEEGQTGDAGLAALHATIERYWAGVRRIEDTLDPPPHDPAPRHGDHVAASLALGADLYVAVGGLPPLACGEDNALVSAVRLHGGRVRHCPEVSITVSARRAGRVEGGMATEMARRARVLSDGDAYCLPPARHWQALVERRRAWRRAWWAGTPAAFRAAGLSPEDIAAAQVEACVNDIAFVERLEARIGDSGLPAFRDVPLDAALAGIDDLLAALHAPVEALSA